MSVRITIDIFSGRANPVIELEGKQAQELLERAKPAREPKPAEVVPVLPAPFLGYRGVILEETQGSPETAPTAMRLIGGQVILPEGVLIPSDERVEDFLFGQRGIIKKTNLEAGLMKFIQQERGRLHEVRSKFLATARKKSVAIKKSSKAKAVSAASCTCAPALELEWWNDGGLKQFNNNCYNYSTNYRSDTFAQPGRPEGIIITGATCVCAFVKPAALADSLIDSPAANNKCPSIGHLVALVMAPGFDFHWYRKGPDGLWSHKVGPAPATNLDNGGLLIPDPRTADRGPYIDFCGFMTVIDGHIKIR